MRTVIRTQYPQLPTLTEPARAQNLPVKWDYPRTEKVIVRNITECLNTPEDKQATPEFKRKCNVNAIDTKSNLFIGLDKQNFNNLVKNMEAAKARDTQWGSRFDTYNDIKKDYDVRSGRVTPKPVVAPKKETVVQRVKSAVLPPKKKPVITAPKPVEEPVATVPTPKPTSGKFPPKKPGH